MTVSSTIRSPGRPGRTSLVAIVAAIAVAGGAASALTFSGGDDAPSALPSNEEILSSLTPEERRYVQWVVSATPEQRAAAFGSGVVAPARRPLKPGANLR